MACTHLLVHDISTWRALKISGLPGEDLVIWSTNPSVILALEGEYDVRDLSEEIPLERTIELGGIVQQVALAWRDTINTHFEGRPLLEQTGSLLGRGVPQLLSACVYAVECTRHIFETDEKVLIPFFYDPPQNHIDRLPSQAMVHIRTNYFALVGEWLRRQGNPVEMLPLAKSRSTVEKGVNSGSGVSVAGVRKKVLEAGLSLFARPDEPWYFLFARLKRILPFRTTSPALLASGDTVIYMLSYPILRLLPQLWFKKSRISFSDTGRKPGREIDTQAYALTELEASLLEQAEELIGMQTHAYHAMAGLGIAARRIVNYLGGEFIHTAEAWNDHLDQGPVRSAEGALLLSNSLGSPMENLHAAAYKAAGAKVVCFQHGAIGLLKHYETMQHFADMAQSDAYVCFTEHEREFYRSVTGDHSQPFYVQGGRCVQRPRAAGLAKWCAKRLWDLPGTGKVVLYAPTRFKEGHVWLPYSIQDTHYWEMIRSLVEHGMADTGADCFVKVHQKGRNGERLPDIYLDRVHPLEVTDLPDNVSLKAWPDLTYCRWAADVLIVDRATSTLGWAMMTDTPLIYLDMPVDPLIPEVREAMSQAAFVIDVAADGWVEQVRDLLAMPLADLQRLWKEKAPARDNFLEYYLLGPSTSPKSNLVQWLQQNAKES